MVDMLDDFAEIHTREFALLDVLARDAVAFDELAAFVVAATLHNLGADSLVQFRISFFGVAEFLAEKAHVVVDLRHAAFRGEILHHLVGHVAGRVTNGAAGGVRSNGRGFARLQNIVKCFVADVGNVHHDTKAVHFANHVFAEIGKAIVDSFVRGRISPFVIPAMGERHVADAQRGVSAQHAEIAVDHVAAFDTHERSDFALFAGIADFGRCRRKNDIIRMLANLLAYRVDLNKGAIYGLGTGYFAGHPNGKENRAEIPFAHAGTVDAPGSAAHAKIELAI